MYMTNMLCKYKDVFGKPNTGAHRYRIADIAIVDVLATVVVAYFISRWLQYSFSYILVAMFALGIVAHRAFCVRTTVDKWLF